MLEDKHDGFKAFMGIMAVILCLFFFVSSCSELYSLQELRELNKRLDSYEKNGTLLDSVWVKVPAKKIPNSR